MSVIAVSRCHVDVECGLERSATKKVETGGGFTFAVTLWSESALTGDRGTRGRKDVKVNISSGILCLMYSIVSETDHARSC
jgi:hypothetical protein